MRDGDKQTQIEHGLAQIVWDRFSTQISTCLERNTELATSTQEACQKVS